MAVAIFHVLSLDDLARKIFISRRGWTVTATAGFTVIISVVSSSFVTHVNKICSTSPITPLFVRGLLAISQIIRGKQLSPEYPKLLKHIIFVNRRNSYTCPARRTSSFRPIPVPVQSVHEKLVSRASIQAAFPEIWLVRVIAGVPFAGQAVIRLEVQRK